MDPINYNPVLPWMPGTQSPCLDPADTPQKVCFASGSTANVTISGGGGGGAYARRLYGVGSPEGVVAAWPGETYVETVTGQLYGKASGDGTSTGWL